MTVAHERPRAERHENVVGAGDDIEASGGRIAPASAAERPGHVSSETSKAEHVAADDEDAGPWPQLPQIELEVCLGETLADLRPGRH